MEFVLTLIASDISLTPAHLARVLGVLADHKIVASDDPSWLTPGKAADIYLVSRPGYAQMADIRSVLKSNRIDALINTAQNRRKKLVLCDMDATILDGETLDDLSEFIGRRQETAAMTERVMRGEMDFTESLHNRVALLKGLPESKLHDVFESTPLMPGARLLISALRQRGTICVLVSGGFTHITGAVARELGFDHHHGNVLEAENGLLTGRVMDPVLDREAKLSILEEHRSRLNLEYGEIMAIGDGANDLAMLQAAGLGIGFHPKPLLAEKLDNLILYGDLSAPLYAQGVVPVQNH